MAGMWAWLKNGGVPYGLNPPAGIKKGIKQLPNPLIFSVSETVRSPIDFTSESPRHRRRRQLP